MDRSTVTEEDLQTEVQALCVDLGLIWHHCRNSRTCDGPKGFPDLTIASRNGLIAVELKSARGDTTPGQDFWLWTLGNNGRLWRPADLDSGRIREQLERLAGQ
jgi:hypothetical protein